MRNALSAAGAIAVGLVAAAVLAERDVPLPPIGPTAEPTCGRTPTTVTLGELPFHSGTLVRVAGLLHAEYEWVALYPSRGALADGWHAPWINLGSLWSEPDQRMRETPPQIRSASRS